jgi:hypothetical protein
MSATDPLSWAFHPDFAEIIVKRDPKVALRLLEVADIALAFARALVAKEYDCASAMLSSSAKSSYPPDVLQKNLEEMIQYSGDESVWPTNVQVVTGADISDMDKWLRKTPQDFGWAYVSVDGDGYCEAVAVMVTDDGGKLAIREIEWGRP